MTITTTPTTQVAATDVYTIDKDESRGPYSGLTTFTVRLIDHHHQGTCVSVKVYHPEREVPKYYAARISWSGTGVTRLARGMAEALRLAADEAERLNEQYAEQWASDEVEHDADWLPRVRMILAELTP